MGSLQSFLNFSAYRPGALHVVLSSIMGMLVKTISKPLTAIATVKSSKKVRAFGCRSLQIQNTTVKDARAANIKSIASRENQ